MFWGLFDTKNENENKKVEYDATGKMKTPWRDTDKTSEDEKLFEKGYKFVKKWEGTHSNDPRDPGKETFGGLSTKYNKNINEKTTEKEKREHYKKKYWEATKANRLDKRFAPIALEMSVNPGTDAGVKIMQRAFGVREDGAIGNQTIEASKKAKFNETLSKIVTERKKYYDEKIKQNPIKKQYKKGWDARSDDMKKYFTED